MGAFDTSIVTENTPEKLENEGEIEAGTPGDADDGGHDSGSEGREAAPGTWRSLKTSPPSSITMTTANPDHALDYVTSRKPMEIHPNLFIQDLKWSESPAWECATGGD